MCDYCDCRSHRQLAELSVEHEQLLSLLADLERAATTGVDPGCTVVELDDLLARHARREERGVFSELRRAAVDDRYLERFERDHLTIHALLAQCRGAEWRPAAARLVDQLRTHIAREETDLFPTAHQLLGPEQWDAVDALAPTGRSDRRTS